MNFYFDLISDIHDDFWDDAHQINWDGLGTSLVAVVAGDISLDLERTYKTVVEISKHYKHVVFIDGNHEHSISSDFEANCQYLHDKFESYRNITYLWKNSAVLDGIAFVGANGWWTYDFSAPEISRIEAINYLADNHYTEEYMANTMNQAISDSHTLNRIVRIMDADPDVKKIVVVTHTAPLRDFGYCRPDQHPAQVSRCGSTLLTRCLQNNTNQKIKMWCFGHVHQEYDKTVDGIRYVSNPRGCQGEIHCKPVYYPKRIQV
jgi:UDP-2,3-diacylglucosamine pyrophosphatase LpxH